MVSRAFIVIHSDSFTIAVNNAYLNPYAFETGSGDSYFNVSRRGRGCEERGWGVGGWVGVGVNVTQTVSINHNYIKPRRVWMEL